MSVVSVMAAYSDLFCVCVCVVRTENHTHAQQVEICIHNTDNAHIGKQSGTIPVILARH